MKKLILTGMLSALAFGTANAAEVYGYNVGPSGYVGSGSGAVVRLSDGSCLRTNFETGNQYVVDCNVPVVLADAPVRLIPAPPVEPSVVRYSQREAMKIFFEFDSARLTPQARDVLDHFIAENGDGVYDIAAAADFIGTVRYNDKLSQRRANAIVDYLERKTGVRIGQVIALGESEARRQYTEECQYSRNKSELINCIAPDRFGIVSIKKRMD